ncbi:MAG: PIG-L family deacetylase [Flavobacteriales bacterium]|nr:PIG-L family deacetylase [Flavobacteriales bacterium]MCW8912276.1 PIG-L family deacetylase [Flavobacteriales bacterium]MCW8937485.1 PIG-L family deacetylase [Flavobacteriales bacterium]MCW8967190.1 PIG-L family deacetylase [Flavobacteriales bacterium]MCW8989108.1 PIG-L family deacetylase [Flavobacteriales bacterium]
MKHPIIIFCLAITFLGFIPKAKAQDPLTAGEIKLALNKLNTLGSVLYLAAHPDDENTRLIAYMANEKLMRTGYLSLTRGDGGQNLIGTEQGALMGVVRTQELLEARKVDGGEQFFTRAVDFGYSKTPEETFAKWDKQKVLADVVYIIRKFRPDVIITRFPKTAYAGHGHHTASAILAEEAFDLAADPKAFPDQLTYVDVWQPKRLFLNASTWWDKDLPEKAKDNPNYITIDVGTYNPLLGKAYSEIAAESRTMHKSQGFGAAKVRGTQTEYLLLKKGDKFNNDVFDGIDFSWNRIEGGKEISALIQEANNNFNAEQPEKIVPTLLEVFNKINALPYSSWKYIKLGETSRLISSCLGLHAEFIVDDYSATPGTLVTGVVNIVNRSNLKVKVTNIGVMEEDSTINIELPKNEMLNINIPFVCKSEANTNPYWLNKPYKGIFDVAQQDMIGAPINRNNNYAAIMLEVEGTFFYLTQPLQYKWTDRVKGEIYRPFVVLPKITAAVPENVYVFSNNETKKVVVTIKAHQNDGKGTVSLALPKGWKHSPEVAEFSIAEKNQEQQIAFMVTPSTEASEVDMKVLINNTPAKEAIFIEYDHIKIQTVLKEASAKMVRLDVKTKGQKIGYIMGAGDEVPNALEQLGYQVVLLDEDKLKNGNLAQFDAILCGIRAYNTNKYMSNVYTPIMDYIKNGGNFIVQYNVNRGLVTDKIGPYNFNISRDRVTEEDAKVTFVDAKHPILNYPNKLTTKDFEGWIQERGLYFADEWADEFQPILMMNDIGETSKKGSIIVAHYGKGSFIYTGISFFRELPAGVNGAFRLFANMVSYKQEVRN